MKKLLAFIVVIACCLSSYSQEYVSEEEIVIEKMHSPFSVGIMPHLFIAVNDYRGDWDSPMGFGLEFSGKYDLDENFSVAAFVRAKALINDFPIPGQGYEGTFTEDGSAAIGGMVEYKMFKRVGFNLILGHEEYFTHKDHTPGVIYGGGINLYLKPATIRHVKHSFNWSIIFEGNNFVEIDMVNPLTNEFEETKLNAFTIQFGWRMNIFGVRPKM